jgi:anti-repressor protein
MGNEFSLDSAIALLESHEKFSVSLENAWQWIGYSSKQAAKKKLVNNFIEGFDWVFIQVDVNSTPQGIQGGRPKEEIALTLDAFKMLGMMAGTPQGRKIREHFLECERMIKAALEESRWEQTRALPDRTQALLNAATLADQDRILREQFPDLVSNHLTSAQRRRNLAEIQRGLTHA